MSGNRWQQRKGAGQFQPRSELNAQQQILLAAVPRWKHVWVRPSTLKPHQSPKYFVKKWVIDTSSEAAEGTEEEMQEALKVVVENKLTESGGGGSISGTATPATLEPQPIKPAASPLALPTPSDSTPISITSPTKPSEGPASSPDSTLPVNAEAVSALKGLPSEGLVEVAEDVTMQDSATEEERDKEPFLEDDVQLAGEALEELPAAEE